MLHDAVELAASGPVAIRYPRGSARQVDPEEGGSGVEGRTVRAGDGSVCILAVGKMLANALKAADRLAADGVEATVWDVRCCAPLDPAMIADAARHRCVVTVEDGIRDGGIGVAIADQIGAIDPVVPVESLGVPARFIPHAASPDRIHDQLGLDPDGIVAAVRRAGATDSRGTPDAS